jgi:hypothetical protein
MSGNLPGAELVRFAIDDFESIWDAVASDPKVRSRGNFLFGKLATTVLELASRLCRADASGVKQREFAEELNARDARYFVQLPGVVWAPSKKTRKALAFPSTIPVGANGQITVLAAIFNLVRNGQAHQYQQIPAQLSDGTIFGISLTGPGPGQFLANAAAGRLDHLSFEENTHAIWLKVRTDVLFVDLRDAVRAVGLDREGLILRHLTANDAFEFDRLAMRAALEKMNAGK